MKRDAILFILTWVVILSVQAMAQQQAEGAAPLAPVSAFLPPLGQTVHYRFSDTIVTPKESRSEAGTLTLTAVGGNEIKATLAIGEKAPRSFAFQVDPTGALQPAAELDPPSDKPHRSGKSEPSAREQAFLLRLSLAARIGAHPGEEMSMPVLLNVPWASGPVNPILYVKPTTPDAFVGEAVWAQDVPTISTDVNLVSLLAAVRDRDGRIVNNLTRDDFELKEDGVPQKIRYFSQESNLPLTIGILVDTSRSQRGVLEQESRASNTFLDQVLREGKDQAFVAHFDTRVETLQGLTSSRKDLAAALGQLSIPDEFATLLYSAIRESSNNVMSKQTGRKAIILLTDGVAFKDPASIETAIESAQRADTILYSIRFSDPIAAYRPLRAAVLEAAKERGKQELERMAKETGGVSYAVTKSQTIEAIYTQIENALRNQYSIGYTPPRAAADGKYHKIKLTTRDHHLIVESRDGYYAR